MNIIECNTNILQGEDVLPLYACIHPFVRLLACNCDVNIVRLRQSSCKESSCSQSNNPPHTP